MKIFSKELRLFFAKTIFFLLAGTSAHSQNYPVQIVVTAIPPYSFNLADYQNHPERILVKLINNSQAALNIQLAGSLTGISNGVSIKTKAGYSSNQPVRMAANSVLDLDTYTISQLFDINSLDFTGTDRNTILRTGGIPEGDYQFCVRAYNYRTQNAYSADVPVGCSNIISIKNIEPPVILNPPSQATIASMPVQNMVFNWTIPPFAPANTQYDFRMVEVPDNIPPAAAMFTDNIVPAYQKTVNINTLLYGPGDPPLIPGKKYALMVRASDPIGHTPFRNGGQSEIVWFQYGEQAPVMALKQNMVVNNCSCKASTPGGPPANNLKPGDIVKLKDDKFSMTITRVQSNNDGTLSGFGTMDLPYFNSLKLQVQFSNASFNSNKQMLAGTITGTSQQPASGLSTSNIKDIVDDAKNIAVANTIMSIPFVFNAGVFKFAVTDFKANAQQVTFSIATAIDIPDGGPGSTLSLASDNICLNDPNTTCDNVTIQLAQDFSIDPIHLTLKANDADPVNNAKIGTYIVLDKNNGTKLTEFHVVASYNFPANTLIDAKTSSALQASFSFDAKEGWGNWIANVTLPQFYVNGLSDFKFAAKNIVYDHSDFTNPDGLPAITGKPELQDNSWHGFYMPQLVIDLPPALGNNLQANITNFIYDANGLSGIANLNNVLSIGNGSLGGWYYSIDNISLSFLNSSFQKSSMLGKVLLPISGNDLGKTSNQIDYSCTLSSQPGADGSSGLNFQFVVQPKNAIDVPIWMAQLNIDGSSSIAVSYQNGQIHATTNISGKLNINAKVDPVGTINFNLMEVQGLTVSTDDPHFKVDKLIAGFNSPDKSLDGFPVSLRNINLTTLNGDIGLQFTLDVRLADFGDNDNSSSSMALPAASTTLTVLSKLDFNNGRPDWKFDGINVDKVAIKGQIGGFEIAGSLAFIHNQKFDNAIEGHLQVNFVGDFACDANALFGVQGDKPFFYLDADLTLPVGIVICTAPGPPISIWGFGGGVYYNLTRDNSLDKFSPGNVSNTSDNDLAKKYMFSDGSVGFKAKILMGSNDGTAFLASGGFEASINIKSFSFTQLVITCNAAYMCLPGSNKWNPDAAIKGGVELNFGIADGIYNMNGYVDINYPPATPGLGPVGYNIAGHLVADLLFSTKNPVGHLAIGTPKMPNNIKFQYTIPGIGTLNLANVTSYFWIGNDGSGDLPDISTVVPGIDKNLLQELVRTPPNAGNNSSGDPAFATGVALTLGGSFDFGPVYLDLTARTGFDLNLQKYIVECNGPGSAPPGINGYYAKGQVYAFFQAGGGIKVHTDALGDIKAPLAEISTTAVAQGGFPDPYYFIGVFNVKIDAAFGLVHGSFNANVKIGQPCTNADFNNPIANIQVIQDILPRGGSGGYGKGDPKNPSIWTLPSASFNLPVDKQLSFDVIDDNTGKTSTHTYSIRIVTFEVINTQKNSNVRNISTSGLVYATDNYAVSLYNPVTDVAFDPYTNYKINVTIIAHDETTNYDYPSQTKSVNFTSGPCVLDNNAIAATLPFENQRYFLSGEISTGYIYLTELPNACLKSSNDGYKLYADFISLDGSTTLTSDATYFDDGNKGYKFNIPADLQGSTVYKLRLVKRVPGQSLASIQSMLAGTESTTNKLATFTTSANGNNFIRANNIGNSSSYGASSNLNVATHSLSSAITIAPEIELISYFFKTSSFKTLKDKLAAISYSSSVPTYTYGGKILSRDISYNAAERFDASDIYGYKKSVSSSVTFSMRPLVVLSEDENNSWYTNFVNPLYHIQGLSNTAGFVDGYEALYQNNYFNKVTFNASGIDQPLLPSECRPKNTTLSGTFNNKALLIH